MLSDVTSIRRDADDAPALPSFDHGFPTITICGLRIHRAPMMAVVAAVDNAIRKRRRLVLGMLNAAKMVNAQHDALLQKSLLHSDVVLADGTPIVWLSRLLGRPLPERVAGIDLMYRLLDLAHRQRYSVYLLGAHEEISRIIEERIRQIYPGCRIAGRRNGYFTDDEEEQVVTAIRLSGADILFLAMSPPKKETFMLRWSDAMRVPVCHGVGGSFDVFAGHTRRAPVWMQRCGLEWFYRVLQEPRRMWKRYLVTNTKFAGLALREIVWRRRPM